jgi:intein/homing endonuclease
MLNEIDKAYIAGFFDGEGTCGLAAYGKNYSFNISYQANVSISNTNKPLLEDIQQILKLGRVECDTKQNRIGLKWKPAYKLWFPQSHIKCFLLMIEPYVRLKRQQIKLVLEFLSLEWLQSKDERSKPPEIVFQENMIYNELLTLNKRGN